MVGRRVELFIHAKLETTARAAEIFVETLLKESAEIAQSSGGNVLHPSHLKRCIEKNKKMDFLTALVEDIPDVQGVEKDDGDEDPDNR